MPTETQVTRETQDTGYTPSFEAYMSRTSALMLSRNAVRRAQDAHVLAIVAEVARVLEMGDGVGLILSECLAGTSEEREALMARLRQLREDCRVGREARALAAGAGRGEVGDGE